MNVRHRQTWFVAMLGTISCIGCDSGVATAPVAGRVTLDGQPLPGAHVSFEPAARGEGVVAGCGSYAKTDADGRFALKLVDGDAPGAVVGTHAVRITTALDIDPHSDSAGAQPERVPLPFRDGSLPFTVPAEGTTTADFSMPGERGA